MKMKKLISLLAAFCMAMTTPSFAMGQEAGVRPGPISEEEFAVLVAEAFPGYALEAPPALSTPLTYARALAALCQALGRGGQTDAENLSFAIENDLITGLAAIGIRTVLPEEARRMVASFAAYRDTQFEQAARESTLAGKSSFTGMTQPMGIVMPSAESTGLYGSGSFPTIDYNGLNDESYGNNGENRFLNPLDSPFSTFALDVDTASYANIRRCLLGGYLPDKGAIRLEEMLNYFDYDLPAPSAEQPISITTELNVCPWNEDHQLAMIALNGYAPDKADLPGSNLVFLVDVSGSMEAYNRLPLARQALKLLVSQLDGRDKVAIVTYAGSAGVLLDTTPADRKEALVKAIDSMDAYGSTNGAGGIQAAYEKAREAYIDGGNNRVILLTDGDFNVGVHSASELESLITKERGDGIYLSVLGFGMGNLKDYEMETLADCGNGNYAYIDTLKEAKKVLVDNMTSTIFTIAKDVKLQVEFNPEKVAAYRLIGYENRLLNTEDFTDDGKDAGEMGAGHQMIALYEIIPAKTGETTPPAAGSRYQETTLKGGEETLYVSVRYKLPAGLGSIETGSGATAAIPFGAMSGNMAFASAVAEFGLILSDSAYKSSASLDSALDRALLSLGGDAFGYRAEFVQLVDLLRLLQDS